MNIHFLFVKWNVSYSKNNNNAFLLFFLGYNYVIKINKLRK